ncbi:MAG: hypothetical protein LBC83_05675 [Oscillospiraceae bacterium]|nr:hypothetical protein [Oscillospiraceae bacterium]
MTLEELRALQTTDPPKEERVDIRNVVIDMDVPVKTRAQQYLEQIKNPYAFRCGEVGVNVEFTPGGKTLQEAMISYLKVLQA